MYKILTHLHTHSPEVYRFYTVNGEVYATDSLDEVAKVSKEILKKIGYKDLKIVDDKDYYVEVTSYSNEEIGTEDIERLEQLLDSVGTSNLTLSNVGDYETEIVWGKKPEPETPKYKVNFEVPEGITVEPAKVEVEEGNTASFKLSFEMEEYSFHLVVNEEDFKEGLPQWITYRADIKELTINNIHSDLAVVLIKD